jgi:hypothetical protein
LVFGLALEVARLTIEADPNAQGNQALVAHGFPLPTGLDREDWDGNGILCTPCVTDAAVDIFTRYISTPALGDLGTNFNLVDAIDANDQDTINPLVKRLRNFYATNLEIFQTALQGQGHNVPNHLSIAAVTIVSHVGNNPTQICRNGERFQFSTYFLDHLFVSGDAAHNDPAVPVPPYVDSFNASEPSVFSFFGKGFPQIALPCVTLLGSYGDPTGHSVACDDQGQVGLQFPDGAAATVNGDVFAFPHAPITAAAEEALGANGLTPLNANVVAWYNATWPAAPPRFAAGAPHQFGQGVNIGDIWFSGWWYSSGQLEPAASFRHSERALGVFLESVYATNLGAGVVAGLAGGALPQAPALPVAYANALVRNEEADRGTTLYMLPNHPNIQPDAVEIYNAIQNTPNVVAVIVHIKNMLRMCNQCAACLRDFTQQYSVIAGNNAVDLGDRYAGQVRFIFVVGSGRGGAIEIYQ